MKGRSPSVSEKRHMNAVQALGCVCCRLDLGVFSPAEIHHVIGKTKPGAHMKVLPLCYRHHREGSDKEEYVSRHPHKRAFEDRYGKEEYLLEQTFSLMRGASE